MEKESFLKNHADTLAIIGVNVAIAALLLTMIISSSHRIDALNARADGLMEMIHNEMTEFRNMWAQESKDFHGRLCIIEERNKK